MGIISARRFPGMVIEACSSMAHDLFGSNYRPELHYMRGPGPKCREQRRIAERAQQMPADGGTTLAQA